MSDLIIWIGVCFFAALVIVTLLLSMENPYDN
jgi:hypothetical protein